MTADTDKKTYKPVLLLILDGWGIRDNGPGNAINEATPEFYESLLEKYPHLAIEASGEAVGLPDGQMGNSEVGHLNLGAGRVVYQEITRINKSIRDGDFFENETLLNAVNHVENTGGTLHLMGLVSDGGVHSDLGHVMALLDFAHEKGVKNLRFHAFLDGRDVPPKSAENYLKEVEKNLLVMDYPQIATVSGRYYAMDRDNRWERVELAYDTIVCPEKRDEDKATFKPFCLDAVDMAYEADITDEFVHPTITDITYRGMQDGDAVIFFNFRPDRARQLTRALTEESFEGFDRKKKVDNLYFASMTMYDETFDLPVAYPKVPLKNILAKVLSENGKKQFRTAETEKYAHVTYFFNGGFETPYDGEDRALVPSPKVATYDLQPEMSIDPVSDKVVEAVESGKYDFIAVNFANPDMVGHTGILEAGIAAVKAVDKAIEKVTTAVLNAGGVMLLTADHGNIEKMIDDDGGPHTAHTTDLVPLILISNDDALNFEIDGNANLSHIAPTVLDLLNVEKPDEMTSGSILKRVPVSV